MKYLLLLASILIFSFANAQDTKVVLTLGSGGGGGGGGGPETDPIVKAISGLIKSNGTTISAATPGTDYLTPTGSAAGLTSFPTLNQNTSGSAATLTTPRAIYGNNFDGSAALTQIIASTYGGTGNAFTQFSGPASAIKTYTLPNVSTTILTTNALVTVGQGGSGANTVTGILIGNGTSAFTAVAGTANQYLRRNSGNTAYEFGSPPGGGDALVANPLSQFASTTSAELAGVISNETGSSLLVFNTSPLFVTPRLSSTSTSGYVWTATDAIGNGSFQAATGGGNAQTANPLSQFASTTSAQLAGVMSDETGTDKLVYNTSPLFVTPRLAATSTIGYIWTATDASGNGSFQVAGAGSGDMVLASIQTVTGAKTFNSGKLIAAGSTSGTTIINAEAVAGSTTVTLPNVTSNLISYKSGTTTSGATITASGDAWINLYSVTALAANTTFAAPTGTAIEGCNVIYTVKDNGTPRLFTWNSIFVGGATLSLPSGTSTGSWMKIQFSWNSNISKFQITGMMEY